MLSVMQLKIMCSFPFGKSRSNYLSFHVSTDYRIAFEPIGVVFLDAIAFGIVANARKPLELLQVEEPADADADRIDETHREQIQREILVLQQHFAGVYCSEAGRKSQPHAPRKRMLFISSSSESTYSSRKWSSSIPAKLQSIT